MTDNHVFTLCSILDISDSYVHDSDTGPWCPEDYDPEFLPKEGD